MNLVSLGYLITVVGSGAYGTVVSVEDLEAQDEESKMAAIKKIERAFEHPLFAKRTLRELKILRLLSHENVSITLYPSISNTSLGCWLKDHPESRNS